MTDAHVVLGRMPPGVRLGGELELDVPAAVRAVRGLARRAGLAWREAALGVLRVVATGMERALRTVSVERGHDPRRFRLVAFGGAGGLHAVELARALGVAEVLVPPEPGVLSAWGMAVAPIQREVVRTRLVPAEGLRARDFAGLVEEARAFLANEGVRTGRGRVALAVDARYRGQSYELTVPWSARSGWVAAFHREHRRRYGHAHPGSPVEVVNLRVRARAARRLPGAPGPRHEAGRRGVARPEARWPVWFDARGPVLSPCYERARLEEGASIRGPAIVREYSATTLVPPGARLRVEPEGTLRIRVSP